MSELEDHVQATVGEKIETHGQTGLNTAVAVLVSLVATFLALCNVKDDNINQAMQQAQARSIDTWSYYQAKSTKQHLAESLVDQFTLQKQLAVGLTAAQAALLDAKVAEFEASVKKYEVQKAEIKAQAEGFQKEYDALNRRDDQFDMSEAMLSIALSLFGITALTQRKSMLGVASVFAGLGFLFGLAGFLQWNLHPDWLAKLLS
jgi:hypothetical protein